MLWVVESDIFKANDVRGKYPEEINEELAYRIGRSAAEFFSTSSIAVARDTRVSSPKLEEALMRGIGETGVTVILIGEATTPMAYFASHHLNMPVVMVTASHNPPGDNGFKFCAPHAVPVGLGSGLEIIRNLTLTERSPSPKPPTLILKEEVLSLYHEFVRKLSPTLSEEVRVMVDVGGAVGYLDIPFWKSVPHLTLASSLYEDPTKPCPHEANPMKPETLIELGALVVSTNANLGIAYDGDGDRVGFVDERGEFVRADFAAALMVESMLKRNPGGLILGDVRASRVLKERVIKLGGKYQECPVGHARIKQLMKETGAIFAAECSNHFYYASPYIAEMGPLPALELLATISSAHSTLSQLLAPLKNAYVQSGEINVRITDAKKLTEETKALFSDCVLSTVDGIKGEYTDWWFSLRSSNTEPVVRLNIEATNMNLLNEKRQIFDELFLRYAAKEESLPQTP